MSVTTLPPTSLDVERRSPRTRWTAIRRTLWVVIALVAVGLLPWFIYPPVAMDIAAWALFAMSIDLLLGFGGLLSFGQAAYWGTSAYLTGWIAVKTGLPFPVAILIGAVGAMVLAVPIGLLSVRRSGIYFAMVTLAFAQVVYFVATQWTDITGGENGLQGVPKTFFGIDIVQSDPFYFYYAAIPIILVGAFIAWRVVHSPFGRVLSGIRDNPARVRALGYDVERYKLIAFVLSAGLAGLAGGVFAISHGFVSLQEVDWTTSGEVVLMTVVGGIGTLWGGPIGAAIMVILEDNLATAGFQGVGLVTGLIFIACVLLFRKGILGTAYSVVDRLNGRRRRADPGPFDTVDSVTATGNVHDDPDDEAPR